MKKVNLNILLVALLTNILLLGQQNHANFYPAVYYTYGDYSNGTQSNSVSIFGKVDVNKFDYIAAGYDKLLIDNSLWSYDQNFFTVGGMKNLYPFYIKVNYGYVQGTYSSKMFTYQYEDQLHVLNSSILYNLDYFFVGIGATYQTMTGYYDLTSGYYEGEIIWCPSKHFRFSISPGYTSTSDSRELLSVGGDIFYQPGNFVNLSLIGFWGERVMYYNPDYMTFYSQFETQKSSAAAIVRLFADQPLTLIISAQYTDFSDYLIRYYSMGIKIKL